MPDAYLPRFISREGRYLPGVKRAVIVPQPAAGADWSVTVPGGRQWRIIGGACTLTTSATVGNRRPAIIVGDESATVARYVCLVQVAASLTAQFGLTPGVSVPTQGASDIIGNIPVPDGWIVGGFQVGASTLNLAAGDQWSALALLVEELYLDDLELSKLHEEKLAALGVEQLPWGPPNQPGA